METAGHLEAAFNKIHGGTTVRLIYLSHTAPILLGSPTTEYANNQPTNTKARYQVDEKRKKLTGTDPNVAAAGRTNLKYMPITPEIRPVAKSSRRGPINRNVQSKHNPTHT